MSEHDQASSQEQASADRVDHNQIDQQSQGHGDNTSQDASQPPQSPQSVPQEDSTKQTSESESFHIEQSSHSPPRDSNSGSQEPVAPEADVDAEVEEGPSVRLDPAVNDDEDDDSDEYDPEANLPEDVAESTASPAPPAPIKLDSVLAQLKPQQPSKGDANSSTDLSKLLSSITKGSSAAPASRSASNTPTIPPASLAPATANNTSSSPPPASSPGQLRPERNVDRPFTPQEQQAYDQYLKDEEDFNRGVLDPNQFEYGSRMFLGNLPTDRITKKQLFLVYNQYGRIAQITTKQAYGFIQFFTVEACKKAMEIDSTQPLMGNRIDLQVSKPQIPKREYQQMMMNKRRERSRSPPRRYSDRDRDGYRDRGDRGDHRDRDRDRGRFRGPPDVQIFVQGRLDPQFVRFVEKGFYNGGLNVRIDELGPRDSLRTAVQQMAYEGVLAVVPLDYALQSSGLVNIQVFERESNGNLRFDEYLSVNLNVAVELANRVKRSRMLPRQPSASMPQGMPMPPSGMPNMPNMPGMPGMPPPGVVPGMPGAPNAGMPGSNVLGTLQNMDPATLQKVVSLLQQQQQQQQSTPPPPPPQSQPPQSYGYQNPPHPSADAAYSGQSTQQVESIMDQLARLQGNR
uniref:ARAD1D37554p n=1 Tax=Blastobotrys adeninivorans TaxID=409370 RepID=A0A060TC81_BLAAD